MPLPVISNVVRNSIEGLCANGQAWANILHTRHTSGAPTTAQIATMAGLIEQLYSGPTFGAPAAALLNFTTTTTTMSQIRSTPLDGTSASIVRPAAHAGTQVSDSLPGGVSLVYTLRTALRGRSFRGRTYSPPQAEGQNGPLGAPLTADVTNQLLQWEGFRIALVTAGWELVVASYLLAQATLVTAITSDAQWDSQRRRNRP